MKGSGASTNAANYVLKTVPIDSITIWSDAQARDLDTDEIDSLVKSIKSEGLQHPLTVTREGRTYKLLAGQRRLEALRRLGHDTVPVLLLDPERFSDVSDAKAVSVIENLHRKNMSAKDMAASCRFLVNNMGKANAARALGITRDTLRGHLGFDGVPDSVKALVPSYVSRRDAVRICKAVPHQEKAVQIIKKISKYDAARRSRYIEALEKLGGSADTSEVSKLANSFRARRNLSVRVSKSQARGLARLSREAGMEPAELAKKIVSDYLARRGIQ